ncbi:MAG TPA: serine O-acetyltransferase [Kofleriaceae bacterium]|jgi:serine O-acetyltransferase|nr:serine O-acetyltransferase [Kofleriaceae bacterium]
MSTERRPIALHGQQLIPSTDVVADQLVDAYFDPSAKEMQHIGSYELPSEAGVERVVELARELLFPGYAGPDVPRSDRREVRELVKQRLGELSEALHRQVYRAAHHKRQQVLGKNELECAECTKRADTVAERFLARLPGLRAAVRLDLRAAFESDPAATGIDEILFCYPGTYAVTVYRIAHALLEEGAVLIPRMMTELAHRRTGIDIHPGATIGPSFFVDHGTGVVIGETTVIGARVRIYQGVTLGALSVPQGDARPDPGARRHPKLEDEVVIYANATILGGETVIGRGAVIGGNAFVTASVAAGTRISGQSRTTTRPT